jgi:hypothetical protein
VKGMPMDRKRAIDNKKVKEMLENPDLERESNEIHSFIEGIIGQKFDQRTVTSKNSKSFHQKCDEIVTNRKQGKPRVDKTEKSKRVGVNQKSFKNHFLQ